MNDRFKFRVWNKEEKRFINFEDVKKQEIEFNFDTIDNHFLIEFNHCKYDVQQCTGLKDKNDKLIYEGDIIRVQYIGAQIPLFSRQFSNLPEDEIFTIIYDHDWHKFRCENPNYKKTCEIHSLDLDAIQINTENKQYEIIGNIYENPELLEEMQ